MIKVLHVDDESSFLELVKFFLEREGDIEVKGSASAEDALEQLKAQTFDAMVIDYGLPGMNGIDLLRILRAQGNDIPVILLTGKGREETASEALECGADLYLQKGTNPQLQFATLVHVIRQSVSRRRSEAESQEAERFLSDVFNSIQGGISVLDKDYNILRVNPMMEKWFPECMPLVGRKCYAVFDNRQSPCPVCPSRETQATGKASHDVMEKLGPGGEVIGWFDVLTFPMLDSRTSEIKGVIEYFEDVTERKRTEIRLNEALERYRVLESTIDNSPVVILAWPPDPRASNLFVSHSVEQYGYSHEEFSAGKRSFQDIVHPEDQERVAKAIDDFVRSGGDHIRLEYRVLAKDGKTHWVVDEVYARRGPDGKVDLYQSLIIDVTPRKLIQEKLEDLTSRMQAIIGAFPDLYFVVRSDGTIMEYKAGEKDDLYVAPSEFMGKRMQDVLPPDVAKTYSQMLLEATKEGSIHPREYALTIQGEKRIFEGRVVPMSKDRFLVIVRNITNRRKAEEALRASEASYRQLVEMAQEGIWMIDSEARTVYANPKMREMLGYSLEEMIGKPPWFFVPKGEADSIKKVVELRTTGPSKGAGDVEYLRKDGTLMSTTVRSATIMDEKGSRGGAIAVVTDISDRKRDEMALKLTNEKLSLLGHVTRHDTLNQMAVLMGWLDIARENVTQPPTSDHLASVKKAALAIQKELEFTADYQSVGVESPGWIDLDRAYRQGVSDLDAKGVTFTIRVKGMEVFADPMLDKVFHNLADNSLRHGEKVTTIGVSYEESKDGLRIVYEDDGVGVPDAEKEAIFHRGKGKHTGYGLHLVKGILGITGIEIKETGVPGKGARFELLVSPDNYRKADLRAQ